jgi:hypothetical protein
MLSIADPDLAPVVSIKGVSQVLVQDLFINFTITDTSLARPSGFVGFAIDNVQNASLKNVQLFIGSMHETVFLGETIPFFVVNNILSLKIQSCEFDVRHQHRKTQFSFLLFKKILDAGRRSVFTDSTKRISGFEVPEVVQYGLPRCH